MMYFCRILIGFIFFSCLFGRAFGEPPRSGLIEANPASPQPAPKVVDAWLDEALNGPEFWKFSSREELESLLSYYRIREPVADTLRRGLRDDFSTSPQPRIRTMGLLHAGEGGYLIAPPNIKSLLPPAFLNTVYKLQRENNYFIQTVRFPSEKKLLELLNEAGVPAEHASLISRNLFYDGPAVYLPLTSEISPLVSPALRTELRKLLTEQAAIHASEYALQLFLVFRDEDDPEQVARRFAGPLKYEALRNEFQALRKKYPRGQIKIPMEEILGSFVQQTAQSFACTGPNCRHSSLAFNQAYPDPPRAMGNQEALSRLQQGYVELKRPSKVGDVLALTIPKLNHIIHMHNYVGQQGKTLYVYTKRGYTNKAPYTFASDTSVMSLYKRIYVRTKPVYFRCGDLLEQSIAAEGTLLHASH